MKRALCTLWSVILVLLMAGKSFAVWGNDFLMLLSREGETQKFYEYILKECENVNLRDKNGITPLMLAAIEGRLDIVKSIIEKGAIVDARDIWGGDTFESGYFTWSS